MGFPVSQSLSPRLHNHWLARYGIDGAYVPMSVEPAQLERAIRALPVLGFKGCNLTLPLKEDALKYVDIIDPIAQTIGAINTLVVQGDGRIKGSNTDAFGFITNLKTSAGGLQKYLGHAVVLGAGGAAKAVVKALLDEGVGCIALVNRTQEKAEQLVVRFGSNVFAAEWQELPALLRTCSLLVNTTSLGMKGQGPLTIDLAPLPETSLVTDIVYSPLETELLKNARARGNAVVDGLGMLIYQATIGFEAWYGKMPEVDAAVRDVLLAP